MGILLNNNKTKYKRKTGNSRIVYFLYDACKLFRSNKSNISCRRMPSDVWSERRRTSKIRYTIKIEYRILQKYITISMILYLFKGIKLVLSNEVYIYINTYLNASIHIHLFLRYNCITQNFI